MILQVIVNSIQIKIQCLFFGVKYISKLLSLVSLITQGQRKPVFIDIKTIISCYFKMLYSLPSNIWIRGFEILISSYFICFHSIIINEFNKLACRIITITSYQAKMLIKPG